MREIPIFFSIDDSYAPFLAAALKSAITKSSNSRNYVAVILHENLSIENQTKLENMATDNFKIKFKEMKNGQRF